MKTIFDTIWEPENGESGSEPGTNPATILSGCQPVVLMCCGGGDYGGPDVGYLGPWYTGGCTPH